MYELKEIETNMKVQQVRRKIVIEASLDEAHVLIMELERMDTTQSVQVHHLWSQLSNVLR